MKALVKRSQAAGDAGLEDVAEPAAPGPGQVVVDVALTGICGTDIHILKGEYRVVPPVVMGHELCGRVGRVGDGVDPSWLGRRVVSETYFHTCGACIHCRSGRRNLCRERQSIGTHVNGAFAPRVLLPAANLHAVPEGVGDRVAALAEPLACVTQSLLVPQPTIAPGQAVLVVGPGTIGLLAAHLAAACGADVTVQGAAADGSRLALARAAGFAVTVAGEEAAPSDAYDVAIECSGNARGIADCLRCVARGGRLVQIGLVGRPAELDYDQICFKEIVVSSGFASTPASWRAAMKLLPKLPLSDLVTDTGGLEAWQDLFDASMKLRGMKYLIAPGGAAPSQ